MSLCHVCMNPMSRATNGKERPHIVCARCNARNESATRTAEDRHFRALRECFEDAARVWAANTLEREA